VVYFLLVMFGQGALTICQRSDGSQRLVWTKDGCSEHECCCEEETQVFAMAHSCTDVLVQVGPLLSERPAMPVTADDTAWTGALLFATPVLSSYGGAQPGSCHGPPFGNAGDRCSFLSVMLRC